MRRRVQIRFWAVAVPFMVAGSLVLSACQSNLIPLSPSPGQNSPGQNRTPYPQQSQPRPQGPQAQNGPRYNLPESSQRWGHPQQQASLPPSQPTHTAPRSVPGGLVRAALLLPLTGPSAKIGQAMLNAAQLGLFEVADTRFILQPYDTLGTPQGAVRAANLAISHGVQVILGPVFSQNIKAIAPYAQASGVGVVSFSTDRSAGSEGVYIMGFLLEQQVNRVIGFARERGLEKFAALVPDSVYGRAVVKALHTAVQLRGGTVTQVEVYNPDGSDSNQVVRRLANYEQRKAALKKQMVELEGKDDEISKQALKRLEQLDTLGKVEFEAVLLPEGGGRLRAVAALLPFYDIDPKRVKLLGTMLWEEPNLGNEPALVGGWFAAPPLGANAGFEKRYARWFGDKPPRIASLAYDAVALAAVLARTPGGPDFRLSALANQSGFTGVNGLFRLMPDGASDRGLAVLEVTRKGFREVSPGGHSFQ